MTVITHKGMVEAVAILVRDGFLGEPGHDELSEVLILKEACAKYVEVSVAKGVQRTNDECREAILVGFFQAYLDDVYKTMVN